MVKMNVILCGLSGPGLALRVLPVDQGLVVGLWDRTEGNPTTTPLLNKVDTKTELWLSSRGGETPYCS